MRGRAQELGCAVADWVETSTRSARRGAFRKACASRTARSPPKLAAALGAPARDNAALAAAACCVAAGSPPPPSRTAPAALARAHPRRIELLGARLCARRRRRTQRPRAGPLLALAGAARAAPPGASVSSTRTCVHLRAARPALRAVTRPSARASPRPRDLAPLLASWLPRSLSAWCRIRTSRWRAAREAEGPTTSSARRSRLLAASRAPMVRPLPPGRLAVGARGAPGASRRTPTQAPARWNRSRSSKRTLLWRSSANSRAARAGPARTSMRSCWWRAPLSTSVSTPAAPSAGIFRLLHPK